MSAQLLPVALQQFIDAASAPLALGKLYSFVTGTATPQALYTDAALTVPFSNPIVLDSLGRIGAPVFMLSTPAYRLRLDSSTGTIQTGWPVDNISGAPPAVITGGTVGYLLTGTGAGAATFQVSPTVLTSQATNDLQYASSASAWARLAASVGYPYFDGTSWAIATPQKAFDDTQAATAANTTETILYTYTAAAGLLGANGRTIRLTAVGSFAANTNTKTVRARWNGIAGTIADSIVVAGSANFLTWRIDATISRIGSNSQRLAGNGLATRAADTWVNAQTLTTAAVTDSGAITLVVTGLNGTAAASDIVYESSWVILT